MSRKYKFHNESGLYFVSFATVYWIDVFTRQLYFDVLAESVSYCRKEKGMEMLILDQTRPDIGLNVVKVIVPGMRHYWRRLGSGRLYEVPVKLGWLKESNPENQLNPLAFIY